MLHIVKASFFEKKVDIEFNFYNIGSVSVSIRIFLIKWNRIRISKIQVRNRIFLNFRSESAFFSMIGSDFEFSKGADPNSNLCKSWIRIRIFLNGRFMIETNIIYL